MSLIFISTFFILTGCFKEEVNTDIPKLGLVQIQLHNFNVPLSGGSLEGSAPDIYYFRQKEDGSYVFMLTSTNFQGFDTKWESEYVLVTADERGTVQKTVVMKFPVNDGSIGNFGYVFDAGAPPTVGPNYAADDKGVLYYMPDPKCYCQNLFFNLHPETGLTEYFSTGPGFPPAQTFRTSDGGFITVGGAGAPDYHKFSASGKLELNNP